MLTITIQRALGKELNKNKPKLMDRQQKRQFTKDRQ